MYAQGEFQLYVASTVNKGHNFLLSQQMVNKITVQLNIIYNFVKVQIHRLEIYNMYIKAWSLTQILQNADYLE